MIADLAPLVGFLPWAILVVLAAAYASLRYRHQLAKAALERVRRERDEALRINWKSVVGDLGGGK